MSLPQMMIPQEEEEEEKEVKSSRKVIVYPVIPLGSIINKVIISYK